MTRAAVPAVYHRRRGPLCERVKKHNSRRLFVGWNDEPAPGPKYLRNRALHGMLGPFGLSLLACPRCGP